jgi:hypothetical protein
MKYNLSVIRPPNKYVALKLYIQGGDKVYREDLNKLGFVRVERTLYAYCVRNKLKMKQINADCWEKTTEKKVRNIDLLGARKASSGDVYSRLELSHLRTLPVDLYLKKYPDRTKNSYDNKKRQLSKRKQRYFHENIAQYI